MNAKRAQLRWAIAGVAFFVLTVWATVAVVRFLQVDSCLDLGGVWNYNSRVCAR